MRVAYVIRITLMSSINVCVCSDIYYCIDIYNKFIYIYVYPYISIYIIYIYIYIYIYIIYMQKGKTHKAFSKISHICVFIYIYRYMSEYGYIEHGLKGSGVWW